MRALLVREPVRVYVLSILTPLLGLLTAKGIVDSDTSLLIGALVAALLSVPAVEVARAHVTPVRVEAVDQPGDAEAGAGEVRLILCGVAAVFLGLLLWALIGDDLRD